jgi:pimeloyl-ACP methyl ester carboxylesterase
MLVDLIQTTTRDGIRLDGVYQSAQAHASPDSGDLDAVVCIHGTGSNFYSSTLFAALAERLVNQGISVLRGNTRGHDLMGSVTTPQGGRRLGAAYEMVDDCRHDLAAWVGWLKASCGPRIGLIGHSLGAVKCLYAQTQEPDLAERLIAISPPRLSHSWFRDSEKSSEFLDTYSRARRLVEAGELKALLEVRLPMAFVITAAGYVEKYGPDERYDYLRFIDKLDCPALLTFAAKEIIDNVAFLEAPAEIARTAPGIRVEVIPGADHFYTGVREDLFGRIELWLASCRSSGK